MAFRRHSSVMPRSSGILSAGTMTVILTMPALVRRPT